MALKSLSQLKELALVIKNETTAGANTATRLGSFFEDYLDSAEYIYGHLWEFVLDGQYTGSTAGLNITSGVRTKITCDSALEDSHSPNLSGATHIWDSATNTLKPLALDDFYIIRFAIQGQCSTQNSYFDLEFDVGGTAGVIYKDTHTFPKGNNTPHSFNSNLSVFVGPDFFTNGGTFYITPSSDSIFWQTGISVTRTYSTP